MAHIKLDYNRPLKDGISVSFKAPCDCAAVDGLCVYYDNAGRLASKVFTFRDTHGNDLTSLGNLFFEGAYVRALLDIVNGYAYLENADTNAYLEGQFGVKQNKLAWATDEDIDAMFDGTYEGEEDEDPEGNGYAEKCYELIETFTLDEAMAWERTQEPDGTPYKFERIYVAMMCPPHNDGQASDGIFRTYYDNQYLVNIWYGAPSSKALNSYAAIEVRPEQGSWRITRSGWEANRYLVNSRQHAAEFGDNWDTKPLYPARTTKEYPYIDKIVHQGTLPAGTKILIWGVRA